MAELTTLEFMEIARRMAATRTDERERGLLDDFLADLEREITNVRGYPRNRWRITHDPKGDLACGHCDACRLRVKGFKEAGVHDPTRYA